MMRLFFCFVLFFTFYKADAQVEHKELMAMLHDEDDMPVADSALEGKIIILFTNKNCLSCFPPLEEKLKKEYPELGIIYVAAAPDGPLQFESLQRRIIASIKYKPVTLFAYEDKPVLNNVWKERLMKPSPQLYISKGKGRFQYCDYNWVGNYLNQ